MSHETEQERLLSRREAIFRVGGLLGGLSLIGGSALLAACEKGGGGAEQRAAATTDGTSAFSAQDVAYLDEVADTILPTTAKSPGAKAAQTGAFMALMVTDTYEPRDQKAFRDGMKTLDDACRKMHSHGFMQSTPEQRLALLTQLDREAKDYMDRRAAAGVAAKSAEAARPIEQAPQGEAANAKKADTGQLAHSKGQGTQAEKALQGDERQQAAVGAGTANPAAAITADAPPHYFRMMKELALLGFFTSEIGYTKATRYQETPGRFDPCIAYKPGDPAWAPHA